MTAEVTDFCQQSLIVRMAILGNFLYIIFFVSIYQTKFFLVRS